MSLICRAVAQVVRGHTAFARRLSQWWLSDSRGRAAVNHENLPGDERGFWRSQQKREAADVFGLA